MRVYLGADHHGFELKGKIKSWLEKEGYEVEDVGNQVFDPDDDYVEFAVKVAEMVMGGEESDRGILLCGSGNGMGIVANKYPRVRAIFGCRDEVVVEGREHEDGNVLVLAADWVKLGEAEERIRLFMETPFSGKTRYERRLAKIAQLEIRR